MDPCKFERQAAKVPYSYAANQPEENSSSSRQAGPRHANPSTAGLIFWKAKARYFNLSRSWDQRIVPAIFKRPRKSKANQRRRLFFWHGARRDRSAPPPGSLSARPACTACRPACTGRRRLSLQQQAGASHGRRAVWEWAARCSAATGCISARMQQTAEAHRETQCQCNGLPREARWVHTSQAATLCAVRDCTKRAPANGTGPGLVESATIARTACQCHFSARLRRHDRLLGIMTTLYHNY